MTPVISGAESETKQPCECNRQQHDRRGLRHEYDDTVHPAPDVEDRIAGPRDVDYSVRDGTVSHEVNHEGLRDPDLEGRPGIVEDAALVAPVHTDAGALDVDPARIVRQNDDAVLAGGDRSDSEGRCTAGRRLVCVEPEILEVCDDRQEALIGYRVEVDKIAGMGGPRVGLGQLTG
jgi:hypothetical protein